MFGIGMPEMLMILAVALIIIGPKKLPDLAKTLGRALGDFKRATNDLKESITVETGIDDVRDNISGVQADLDASISLDDEAPKPATIDHSQTKAPEEPLAKVKEAFDQLNNGSDTPQGPADEAGDGTAEEAPDTEDKTTP